MFSQFSDHNDDTISTNEINNPSNDYNPYHEYYHEYNPSNIDREEYPPKYPWNINSSWLPPISLCRRFVCFYLLHVFFVITLFCVDILVLFIMALTVLICPTQFL